jgi:hypothetical protein
MTGLDAPAFSISGTWAAVANIWFVVWAVRRRGEFDYKLDTTAKLARWLIALVCLFAAIQLPQLLNPPPLRICVGLIGLTFLVWPNTAYHLTRILRRLKVLPERDSRISN